MKKPNVKLTPKLMPGSRFFRRGVDEVIVFRRVSLMSALRSGPPKRLVCDMSAVIRRITSTIGNFRVPSGGPVILLMLAMFLATLGPERAIGIWPWFETGGSWDDPTKWLDDSLPIAGGDFAVGPVLLERDSIVFRRFLAPGEAFRTGSVGHFNQSRQKA